MTTQKYRPCLTPSQISHVLSLCKKELSDVSMSVISVLAPFKAKIENNGIAPAYVTESNKLRTGFTQLGELEELLTPHQLRRKAFEKWTENPDACSVDELELVQTYRFENDLMGEEEAAEFELKVFGGF